MLTVAARVLFCRSVLSRRGERMGLTQEEGESKKRANPRNCPRKPCMFTYRSKLAAVGVAPTTGHDH
ncbi:hypothetical protein HYQ44_002355 [Verticillium longisporum]|nr:hypothetical protein HYQ44_002355 [Verticillium longisporum]